MGFRNQQEIQAVLNQEVPKNQATRQLSKAKEQKLRTNFHAATVIDDSEARELSRHFIEVVEKRLVSEKLASFLATFRFPLLSAPLIDEIYKKISKVFEGRNPVKYYEFASQREHQDWINYRSEVLNLDEWWRVKGLQAMRTMISSVVVADLPQKQNGDRPEPYLYFVDIDDILHIGTADYLQVDWIIFGQSENQISVYDDEYYRVYEVEDGKHIKKLLAEFKHELGICPVRYFWSDSVNVKNKGVKKHLLQMWLTSLDDFTYYSFANEDLNAYARYPVSSSFDVPCHFEDKTTGVYCKSGFIVGKDGGYMYNNREIVTCPECSKKRFNGPGSHISVKPPSPANDQADQRNPFTQSVIPRDSLDYNNDDLRERAKKIFGALTGVWDTPINDQAVNESQVGAMMESREAALVDVQRNLEAVISWADNVLCNLRYSSFQRVVYSMGTEHFVMNSSELIQLYEVAKKAGLSHNILDQLQDRYFDSEYRHNPQMKERQKMFDLLDPFRHVSNEGVSALLTTGKIGLESYMMKVNLSSLVARFENEFFPITSFPNSVPMKRRIEVIKEALLMYVEEFKEEAPEPEPIGEGGFN